MVSGSCKQATKGARSVVGKVGARRGYRTLPARGYSQGASGGTLLAHRKPAGELSGCLHHGAYVYIMTKVDVSELSGCVGGACTPQARGSVCLPQFATICACTLAVPVCTLTSLHVTHADGPAVLPLTLPLTLPHTLPHTPCHMQARYLVVPAPPEGMSLSELSAFKPVSGTSLKMVRRYDAVTLGAKVDTKRLKCVVLGRTEHSTEEPRN